MPQKDVDLVQHREDGPIDRDPERLLALTAADVEYVITPEAVEPESGVVGSKHASLSQHRRFLRQHPARGQRAVRCWGDSGR